MDDMEQMDEMCSKLQVLLMRKNEGCEKLRFLTCKTTIEICEHIEDVCNSVCDIVRKCSIPVEDESSRKNGRCVQAFKYLLLNSCFECQEHLAEDTSNGHLVDMCPPLSPYLLIEVLWRLKFEELVAESILYIPLDLCVELIEITRRCVLLLDFPRGLNFVTALALNTYKKLIIIEKTGTQTVSLQEKLQLLIIHCEELMVLLCDTKFMRLEDTTGLKRSERHGILLKSILTLTENCLESRKNNVTLFPEMESMYKLTFGRLPIQRYDNDSAEHLDILINDCVNVLLKKLKQVDCNTYIDWASLELTENSSVSLQQSIGYQCYNLIEFIRECPDLEQHNHLIECLQQFSTNKPNSAQSTTSSSLMNLDQLHNGASEGKRECIKELVNRYKEWNDATLGIIRNNYSLLDKDDFLNLLEYLTMIITKPGEENHKRQVYAMITNVLFKQSITDVYDAVLEYIIKHDGRNTLESMYTEECFDKFIAHNSNLKSSSNLRTLLFYLMKNPRKILSILVKMTIGDAKYENVMVSPHDLTIISPIMNIVQTNDEETLLLGVLRTVCTESDQWNTKKFTHFLQVMLDNGVFTSDKLVNCVFIPCLETRDMKTVNLRSILYTLRKFAPTCTKKMNLTRLITALGKRMIQLRNDISAPKHSSNELLKLITRILESLLRNKNWIDAKSRTSLIEDIERSLEPIDKHHFAQLYLPSISPSSSSSSGSCPPVDISDTIKDYERRCFIVMNRVLASQEIIKDDTNNLHSDFSRFERHFVRHLIVKSAEPEYMKFATDAMIFNWSNFGCKNEYEAYDKLIGITVEACIYCLYYPNRNPPESFAFLLKSVVRFTQGISSLEQVQDTNNIYESLVNYLKNLNEIVKETAFASLYARVMLLINNRANSETPRNSLCQLLQSIHDFATDCLEITHSQVQQYSPSVPSPEALRYRIAHDFIAECMNINHDAITYQSLCTIYKLLSSSASLSGLSS